MGHARGDMSNGFLLISPARSSLFLRCPCIATNNARRHATCRGHGSDDTLLCRTTTGACTVAITTIAGAAVAATAVADAAFARTMRVLYFGNFCCVGVSEGHAVSSCVSVCATRTLSRASLFCFALRRRLTENIEKHSSSSISSSKLFVFCAAFDRRRSIVSVELLLPQGIHYAI